MFAIVVAGTEMSDAAAAGTCMTSCDETGNGNVLCLYSLCAYACRKNVCWLFLCKMARCALHYTVAFAKRKPDLLFLISSSHVSIPSYVWAIRREGSFRFPPRSCLHFYCD